MKLSLFFKRNKSRDKPVINSISSSIPFLFGTTTYGKAVNERTALQTTAIYSYVRILVETTASLPLHLYQYKGKGKEKIYDHNLYRLLHDEPDPEMTSFVFRENTDE